MFHKLEHFLTEHHKNTNRFEFEDQKAFLSSFNFVSFEEDRRLRHTEYFQMRLLET